MIDWYKKVVFENYANFNGRARRSEYWYFTLASTIISIILSVLDSSIGLKIGSSDSGILSSIYSLVIFVPSIAVSFRRLHDVGKSGWLLIIAYAVIIVAAAGLVLTSMPEFAGDSLPEFGAVFIIAILIILGLAIWMLVLFFTEGDSGPNKYGPDPKAFGEEINEIGTE